MNTADLSARLDALPDLGLARTPTPLHPVPNFQAAIQETCEQPIPDIYLKRDDTTGFGFGGNKARHMGIAFARFVADDVETIVNINHFHSNQARFIAAACAKTGIKCHLVASDMVDAPMNGNLLLAKLFGAEIHRVPQEYSRQVAEELVDQERGMARHTAIYADYDRTDIAGMMGFVKAGRETHAQLDEFDIADSPIRIWGLTGRSISGMRLYAKNAGLQWSASATRYTPIAADASISGADASMDFQAVDRSQQAAEVLGLDTALESGDVPTLNGYAGDAYGVPHDGVFEAMHMLAGTEGVILDPNYTGKSMAALIGELRRGALDPDVPVVYLHSGGLPQVFAHAEAIWNWKPDDA